MGENKRADLDVNADQEKEEEKHEKEEEEHDDDEEEYYDDVWDDYEYDDLEDTEPQVTKRPTVDFARLVQIQNQVR